MFFISDSAGSTFDDSWGSKTKKSNQHHSSSQTDYFSTRPTASKRKSSLKDKDGSSGKRSSNLITQCQELIENDSDDDAASQFSSPEDVSSTDSSGKLLKFITQQ